MNRPLIWYMLIVMCFGACVEKTQVPTAKGKLTNDPHEIEDSGRPTAAQGIKKDRYAWQKPALVVDKIGDTAGKVIADIGAGTGYFAFRLIGKAERVIAVDIDPDMLNLIEQFRENLDSLQQTKITTRLADQDGPNLKENEIDIALIINTIGFITDRNTYLQNLRSAIKTGGEIMIVDFKMKRIPDDIAPEVQYRVSLLELENILSESGYTDIVTDDTSLDYQYIVKASRDQY